MGIDLDSTQHKSRLEVIGKDPNNPRRLICKCVCGSVKSIIAKSVTSNTTKSCGCLAREVISANSKTHGDSHTPTHRSWSAMMHRCRCSTSKDYARYGGSGITVCKEWDSYERFKQDMGERPTGTSLDRLDTLGNYEPGNCRWASIKEQNMNRRNVQLYSLGGEWLTLKELCEELNAPFHRIQYRVQKVGWPVTIAILFPKEYRNA